MLLQVALDTCNYRCLKTTYYYYRKVDGKWKLWVCGPGSDGMSGTRAHAPEAWSFRIGQLWAGRCFLWHLQRQGGDEWLKSPDSRTLKWKWVRLSERLA